MMHHMFKSSAPSGYSIEIVAEGAGESFITDGDTFSSKNLQM